MDTFLNMVGALGLGSVAATFLALAIWGLWLLYQGLREYLCEKERL